MMSPTEYVRPVDRCHEHGDEEPETEVDERPAKLRRHRGLLTAVGCTVLLAGCGEKQSTLHAVSPPARKIEGLWWAMMTGAWIVFAAVVTLLVLAWVRRRSGPRSGSDRGPTIVVVTGGLVAPVVVLSILFVFVLRTMPATSAPEPGTTALIVQVIGHQWFWEVRYPGTRAVTANEIHIPAETRVNLEVTTADVIHSFWVPELNRKIDMNPGRVNRILLEADQPGVYRGQCSEFCGLQHAHMAMAVYADPPERFRAWLAATAAPRRAPQTPGARRGEQVFLSEACAGCHTIRGTAAQAGIGPDLTHLASRNTLAALTIPNDRAYLSAWIVDPQHFKPGNKMPGLQLTEQELNGLLDYLEGLK